MKTLTDALNRRLSIRLAAAFLGSAYLASRLLGLVRDRLLASHFGIGPLVDAYTAAFRLPDLLFTLLASGGFAVAFIPIVTRHLQQEDRERAWELTANLLNLLLIITLIGGVVIEVAADPLISLITPGFDPARHDLAVHLTRIMAVTPIFFAVSSVLGALQQAVGRFIFFAASSLLYNVGIIIGIIFLSPQHSIYGVAYGVVLGAAAQAGLQILGIRGLGWRWRRRLGVREPGVRRVLSLMVPRSLDEGIDQINYTVETIIGSGLAAGSLTALYYANNLKNVPLVIFGSALATTAFPTLAAVAADKVKLVAQFVSTARSILFLVIPAAVAAIVMRGYIVRLLFGFGNVATANTLGWFAGAIVFQSLFFLVTRMYYALQDTKTPLFISIVAIAFNVAASLLLSRRFGVAGLAAAQSLVIMLETGALLLILRRRIGRLGGRTLLGGIVPMLLASAIMGSLVYLLIHTILPLYRADRGLSVVGPKFLALAIIGALAYFIPCYLLRLNEARQLWRRLMQPFQH